MSILQNKINKLVKEKIKYKKNQPEVVDLESKESITRYTHASIEVADITDEINTIQLQLVYLTDTINKCRGKLSLTNKKLLVNQKKLHPLIKDFNNL